MRNSYEKSSTTGQILKNLSVKCIIDYVNLLNDLWDKLILKNKIENPNTNQTTSNDTTHLTIEEFNSDTEKEVKNFLKHLEIYFLYLQKRNAKKNHFNFEQSIIDQLNIINIDFELKKFSIDYYLYMEESLEDDTKKKLNHITYLHDQKFNLNPKQIYVISYYVIDLNEFLHNLVQCSINFNTALNETVINKNFKIFQNYINNSLTRDEKFCENNQFLKCLFVKIVTQNLINQITLKINNTNLTTILNLSRNIKYDFNGSTTNRKVKNEKSKKVKEDKNQSIKLILKLFKCSWTYLCEVLIDYMCNNYDGKYYNECLACVYNMSKLNSNEFSEKNLDYELDQLFHLIYEHTKSTKHYTENSFSLNQIRLVDFILYLTSTISSNKRSVNVDELSISIYSKYYLKFSFLFINQQKLKNKDEPQQQDEFSPTFLTPVKVNQENYYSFLDIDYVNLKITKIELLNNLKIKIESALAEPTLFKQLILFSLINIFNSDHDSFLNNNFLNYNSLIIDKLNELFNNLIKNNFSVSCIHIINQLQYFVNNYIMKISEKTKTELNFTSVLRVLVKETIHKTSLYFIQTNLDYYEAYLSLHENINENLLDLLNKYFNFSEYFLETYDLLSDIKSFETNDLLLICVCELVDCFSALIEQKWKKIFNILQKMKFITLLEDSISSSRESITSSIANQDQYRSQFNILIDILNVYLKSKTLTCAFDFIGCLKFFLSYEVSKNKNQTFDDDFEECVVDLDEMRDDLRNHLILNDTFEYSNLNEQREDDDASVFVKPFLNSYKIFFNYLLELYQLNFNDNRVYDEYEINFNRLNIENRFMIENINENIYVLFNRFNLRRLDENKAFNNKFKIHLENQSCSLNSLIIHLFESLCTSLFNTANEINAVAINESIIDLFSNLKLNQELSYISVFILNEIIIAEFNDDIDYIEKSFRHEDNKDDNVDDDENEIKNKKKFNKTLIRNKIFVSKFLYKRLQQFFKIISELKCEKFLINLSMNNLNALYLKILYLKLHNYELCIELDSLQLIKNYSSLYQNDTDFFVMLHVLCSEYLETIAFNYKQENLFPISDNLNYFYSNFEILTSNIKTNWQLYQIKKCFHIAKYIFTNTQNYEYELDKQYDINDRFIRNFTLKILNLDLNCEYKINLNDFVRSLKLLNDLLGIFEHLIKQKLITFETTFLYCLFKINFLSSFCDELITLKVLVKKIFHLNYEHELISFFLPIKKSFQSLTVMFKNLIKQQHLCDINTSAAHDYECYLNIFKNGIINNEEVEMNQKMEFFSFFFKKLLENYEKLYELIILNSSRTYNDENQMENYFNNDNKYRYSIISKELVGYIVAEFKENKSFYNEGNKIFLNVFENLFLFLNKSSSLTSKNEFF
jgi:hypothetical protein